MPSPTKASFSCGPFAARSFFDLRDLVAGEKLAADLVHAELGRYLLGHALRVTGKHDGLFHARIFERGDGFLCVRLRHIGDDDMASVLPVDRHMDDRTDAVAFNGFDAELFHQLGVARGDGGRPPRR